MFLARVEICTRATSATDASASPLCPIHLGRSSQFLDCCHLLLQYRLHRWVTCADGIPQPSSPTVKDLFFSSTWMDILVLPASRLLFTTSSRACARQEIWTWERTLECTDMGKGIIGLGCVSMLLRGVAGWAECVCGKRNWSCNRETRFAAWTDMWELAGGVGWARLSWTIQNLGWLDKITY